MKLHEFQAKELLKTYGIPVPDGAPANSPEEATKIAERLGGKVVVKAQVHAGGRGKAGGVKVVESPSDAAEVSRTLIGSRLITFQTGPDGAPVTSVLVEQTVDVAKEFYLSLTTDPGARRPVMIASSAGGMEIEEVAHTDPDMILREYVDPAIGMKPFQARRLAEKLGLPNTAINPFITLTTSCYKAYMDLDCTLIEINPLVLTVDGDVLALDAKMVLDDDALFRHGKSKDLRDVSQEDPLEMEAANNGIAYVKLDGNVGCMVNGAGLAMATMDIVKAAGAEPANFLDVGGGATDEKVARAISIMLSDTSVSRVLVNIFGGILRCDIAARGIVSAYQSSAHTPPLVVRMLGTNVVEGKQILEQANIDLVLVDTLQEAAKAIATT